MMPLGEWSSRSKWLAAAAFYFVLTLIYAWPVVIHFGQVLPSDLGDPALNSWILWWEAHSVPLTTRWWNAPMFFPAPGAMALSETLLSLWPLTTPLQWLGSSATVAYNVAFLLAFFASAMAAHALAYRLTKRHDASLIAGLAFGFSPYRAAQLPHLQVLCAYWLPLSLLALHRYVSTRRWRDLALFGVCWLMNGLTTGYFLVYFAVLVGLWMIFFLRTRRDWIAVSITAIVASLPLVPIMLGYARHQAALGLSRDVGEIQTFSADLTAIWATSTNTWLPSKWTRVPGPEGELYPGIAIMALVAIAGFAAWRIQQKQRWPRWRRWMGIVGLVSLTIAVFSWIVGQWSFSLLGADVSGRHPAKTFTVGFWLLAIAFAGDSRIVGGWRRRSPFFFYTVAAAVMLLFALGPLGRAFGADFLQATPYNVLLMLPGGHSLRAPARFATFFVLCLSLAAAIAFSRLTRSGATIKVIALVVVLILADSWVPMMPTGLVPRSYDLTATGAEPSAVVMELPFEDVYSDTAALLRATAHGHPVVNGYSGYFPAHYEPIVNGMRHLDIGIINALRQYAPLVVFVNRQLDDDGSVRKFMDGIAANERTQTGQGPLYRLSQFPPAPSPDVGGALPIASVETNSGEQTANLMKDGDPTTRWESFGPQSVGQQVSIDLGKTAGITRVELDLASWRLDYPRGLTISVSDGATFTTVWEGSTAAAAMRGALADFRMMPVVIDLSRQLPGRQIILRSTGSHEVYSWSIAEIRVFGR